MKCLHPIYRRATKRWPWLLLCLILGLPNAALADQPRDWMFSRRDEGTLLLLDYFGTGAQAGIEHNVSIFGEANNLSTAVHTLVGYPLGEVTVRSDLRILFLSIGATLGYRTVWRNMTFEAGEDGEYCRDCDRGARRKQDPIFGQAPSTDRFGFLEGRLRLFAPFNKHAILVSLLGTRYEGRQDRSYDWFYTNIHDGGWNTRWETTLFLKHRDWGGIAPYVQMMTLPRSGEREVEWAYGFNLVTRPGFIRSNDLLFLTFLMRPGDRFYGHHSYYAPIRALLIYRAQFEL